MGEDEREQRGPTWALASGCIALALAIAVIAGNASDETRTSSEATGYVLGAVAFPFLVVLAGRAIVVKLSNRPARVVDWAWLAFGTGFLALFLALGSAGAS